MTSVSAESMHDVLMIESSCTSLMQVHLYYSDPTYIFIKYTLWKDWSFKTKSVGQNSRVVTHNLKGLWHLHFFLKLQTRTQQSLWTKSDFYTVTAQKWQEYNCSLSIFDISAIVAIDAC